MICTIEGKQYDIPASIIKQINRSTKVITPDGNITESDFDCWTELSSHDTHLIKIQHMWLYFELPDGTTTRTLPVGVKSEYCIGHGQFLVINKFDLYDIECRTCGQHTLAVNISDLLNQHVDDQGKFICAHCTGTDTFILRDGTDVIEERDGEICDVKQAGWIKGVIKIDSEIEKSQLCVFLTADAEDGAPTGLHFKSYKNTVANSNESQPYIHEPSESVLLDMANIPAIIEQLAARGLSSRIVMKDFAVRLA